MIGRDAVVLLGYAAISFAYWGWGLVRHPSGSLIGSKQDPLIFVWSFEWYPRAILSWTNPLFTHAIYAPEGINLAWTATVPALALAFSPVTLLFGPAVSYNVAALLLPALAAWTAYLLCRHVTGSTWASLIGGYVFGFSAYIAGQQTQGHLHLTSVFLLPLVALAVIRYSEGSLDSRGLAWRLSALFAGQLYLSTEVALTMTIALGVALLLALLSFPDARPRLRSAVAPIVAGYGGAALLTLPLLAYVVVVVPSRPFTGAEISGTDALNLILPTSVNGLAGSYFRSFATHFNPTESASYLGLPILLIVALFAWRARGRRGAPLLVGGLVLALVLALGPVLRVDGRDIVTLPWTFASEIPLLRDARLPRLAVYASLAAAVIVAIWTARTPGRTYARPYVLPILAVAALVPNVAHASYRTDRERPAFFAERLHEGCITRGETLLVFPFGFAGDSMLWQAESSFWFRLAEGYMYPLVHDGPRLTRFDEDLTVRSLNFEAHRERPTMNRLLAFAATHGVDRLIVVEGADYPSEKQLQRFGPVERRGGVLVAPGCDSPSLRTHDLGPFVEEAKEQSGREIVYCLEGNTYTVLDGFYPAGIIARAKPAPYVVGVGLGCDPPPPDYVRRGFATEAEGVPPRTYPLYAPP